MSWSYDETTLGTTTATERLNSVRYLIGDTDVNSQQVQDEEIYFSLAQANDDIYSAAAHVSNTLASKYSSWVTVELDGTLRVEYSKLADQYRTLAFELKEQGKTYSATSLGFYFGGTSKAAMEAVRADTDRVQPAFRMDRFRFPQSDISETDYTDD